VLFRDSRLTFDWTETVKRISFFSRQFFVKVKIEESSRVPLSVDSCIPDMHLSPFGDFHILLFSSTIEL
jgi:hypothetical protein